MVVSELMGVPAEHQEMVCQKVGAFVRARGLTQTQSTVDEADDSMAFYSEYFLPLIHEKRRHLSDDLLSRLISDHEEDVHLTDEQLLLVISSNFIRQVSIPFGSWLEHWYGPYQCIQRCIRAFELIVNCWRQHLRRCCVGSRLLRRLMPALLWKIWRLMGRWFMQVNRSRYWLVLQIVILGFLKSRPIFDRQKPQSTSKFCSWIASVFGLASCKNGRKVRPQCALRSL